LPVWANSRSAVRFLLQLNYFPSFPISEQQPYDLHAQVWRKVEVQ
jgi:hypothetical protein